jgi:hypothetical protein
MGDRPPKMEEIARSVESSSEADPRLLRYLAHRPAVRRLIEVIRRTGAESRTQDEFLAGTARYAPPEQLERPPARSKATVASMASAIHMVVWESRHELLRDENSWQRLVTESAHCLHRLMPPGCDSSWVWALADALARVAQNPGDDKYFDAAASVLHEGLEHGNEGTRQAAASVLAVIENENILAEIAKKIKNRPRERDESPRQEELLRPPKEERQPSQAELAAEYPAAHKQLLVDRADFLKRANKELAPRLSAWVQERLKEDPPVDREAKERFAYELNTSLEQLGLGVLCPITGLVGYFRVPSSGEFHLIPFGHKNPSINRTDIAQFFADLTGRKPLQFALAVSTKAARVRTGPGPGPGPGPSR